MDDNALNVRGRSSLGGWLHHASASASGDDCAITTLTQSHWVRLRLQKAGPIALESQNHSKKRATGLLEVVSNALSESGHGRGSVRIHVHELRGTVYPG